MGRYSKPPPPPPPAFDVFVDTVKTCAADPLNSCEPQYLVAFAVVALTLLYLLVLRPARLDPISAKLALAEAKRRRQRAEIVILTFRALKAVAMADGVFHETEEELLYSISEELPDLVELVPDLDEIYPITPAELAAKTELLAGPAPSKGLDYMRLRLLVLMCAPRRARRNSFVAPSSARRAQRLPRRRRAPSRPRAAQVPRRARRRRRGQGGDPAHRRVRRRLRLPALVDEPGAAVGRRPPAKEGWEGAGDEGEGRRPPRARVGALAGAHRQRRLLRRLREPLPPLSPSCAAGPQHISRSVCIVY